MLQNDAKAQETDIKTDDSDSRNTPSADDGFPFAYGMNFYKLFWVFFICCILGVVIETLWCIAKYHVIENRAGVIYGPFNPVYGFGAVIMTLLLRRLNSQRNVLIFFGGMAIGGIFEWLCSFFQELAFGTVSWEYSDMPGSILGGRTNLVYMLFWAILCLLWVKTLYPWLSSWIERIPRKAGTILTWCLTVFMVFNMGISCLAVNRQAERRDGVAANGHLDAFLDEKYPDDFLARIYPNMIVVED